ncbi:MAG: EVE domain-containing protein [Gammaproteobacteria bacterium]|nr:EVE domain-containing protein [Gammaproteobacteria bacterium]
MAKQYWLMKSEPDAFSIDDLIKAKGQTSHWDGVRNYQARNFIKNGMKVGDLAFFYHSSCKVPGIVGTVEIITPPQPDPSAFDPKSPYFDAKSTQTHPRWYMVDVKFKQKFNDPITLESLRMNPLLKGFTLLNKGNRLSVMPVSFAQWQTILKMMSSPKDK